MTTSLWRKFALFLLVLPVIFLIITMPMAYMHSENIEYNIGENHTYPTINGYFYYLTENYSEVHNRAIFDENGVVLADYGGNLGRQYNPVTISQYVLSIAPYASTKSDAYDSMVVNLDFLLSNSKITAGDNLIHPYTFDWPINNETAPWYSSMAQGQAASALLWGYRTTNDTKYLDGAKKTVFALIEENSTVPFIKEKNGGIWLKEYPNYKYEVLDGSLAAIAGVYDLYRSMDASDPDRKVVELLLSESIIGFKLSSHEFDSTLFGHYYDNKRIIPNPNYYSANLALLEYLLTYDGELETIRNKYMMEDCGRIKKLIIWYWNRGKYIYHRVMP